MTALARHSFPVVSGRSHAFVSFVSFVVGCGPASVDGYSRRRVNHEIHETHENVWIGFAGIVVAWQFTSRLETLDARRESGTLVRNGRWRRLPLATGRIPMNQDDARGR